MSAESIPAQELELDQVASAVLSRIRDEMGRGHLSGGDASLEFERAYSPLVNGRHCVALASGTVALELIAQAMDVHGKTVLVPANTNFATYVAMWRAGANVRLIDVDPHTLSPKLQHVADALGPDVAAVVLVHMGGLIAPDIEAIQELCRDANVYLIEDAAHAPGSSRSETPAGAFGDAAGFSFFATKVLAAGEGGLAVCRDDSLAAKIRQLRDLGKREPWVSEHHAMGTNARMHLFAALLLIEQVALLPTYVAKRQAVADVYAKSLSGSAGVEWIVPDHPYSGYKAWGLLNDVIRRADVKREMAAQGVQLPGEIYAVPLHHQPVLADTHGGECHPGAEEAARRQTCLPIYPSLGTSRASHVADVFAQVIARLSE